MSKTLTAELSLYPLAEDYAPIIESFIESLSKYEGLDVLVTATCTQLEGPDDVVFRAVQEAFRASEEKYGKQVLVCKYFSGARNIRKYAQ